MSASSYNDPAMREPNYLETTTTMVGGGSHTHRRIGGSLAVQRRLQVSQRGVR